MLALWQQNKTVCQSDGEMVTTYPDLKDYDTSLTFTTLLVTPNRQPSCKREDPPHIGALKREDPPQMLRRGRTPFPDALCSNQSALFRTTPALLVEIVGSQGHLSFH